MLFRTHNSSQWIVSSSLIPHSLALLSPSKLSIDKGCFGLVSDVLVMNHELRQICVVNGSINYLNLNSSSAVSALSENSMIVYDFNEAMEESLDTSSLLLDLSKSAETFRNLDEDPENNQSQISPVLADRTSYVITSNGVVSYHSYTRLPCYSPDLSPDFFRWSLTPNWKQKFSFLTTISESQIQTIPPRDDHTHYVRGYCVGNETVVTEWNGQSCHLSDYTFSLRYGLSLYPKSSLNDVNFLVVESSLVVFNMTEEFSPKSFRDIREIVFCPGSLLHTDNLDLSSFWRVLSIVFLPFCDCTAEEFGSTLMGAGSRLRIRIANCRNLRRINFHHHSCIRGSSLVLQSLPALSSLKIGFASGDGSWEQSSCCFSQCTSLDLSSILPVRVRL